eukprot:3618145-Amphidinium_carterae.1
MYIADVVNPFPFPPPPPQLATCRNCVMALLYIYTLRTRSSKNPATLRKVCKLPRNHSKKTAIVKWRQVGKEQLALQVSQIKSDVSGTVCGHACSLWCTQVPHPHCAAGAQPLTHHLQ